MQYILPCEIPIETNAAADSGRHGGQNVKQTIAPLLEALLMAVLASTVTAAPIGTTDPAFRELRGARLALGLDIGHDAVRLDGVMSLAEGAARLGYVSGGGGRDVSVTLRYRTLRVNRSTPEGFASVLPEGLRETYAGLRALRRTFALVLRRFVHGAESHSATTPQPIP